MDSVKGIDSYRLDNGLKVLLFQDKSAQTITVNVTYRVSSRHEGYGEKGMVHLLEHLVFFKECLIILISQMNRLLIVQDQMYLQEF